MSDKFNKKWLVSLTAILLFLAGVLASCSSGSAYNTATPTPTTSTITLASTPATAVPATSQPVSLNGAGATFPAPLYTKWFSEYAKLTGIEINYGAVGSGSGINQITVGTVDFGASDGIMTDAQITTAQDAFGSILHIPMTMGPVAIVYNLPGIGIEQIKLSGEVLANIYLKKIQKWNDPVIAMLNPGTALPDTAIAVVHRSDGSGTTYIFTNYLSKVSPDWVSQVGNATSVNWPGDIGGQGNAGVAAQVQQTPGAIGYVELAYAIQNNMKFAQLKNSSGNYISPSLTSASKAADGVTLPDDMKVMITNSSNPTAYPIVGFTWILVYQNQTDKVKGQELVDMLWWAIHDGQQYSNALNYPTLPAGAVTKAEAEIRSIEYQGQPLLNK